MIGTVQCVVLDCLDGASLARFGHPFCLLQAR
jgi:hypothetical protein